VLQKQVALRTLLLERGNAPTRVEVLLQQPGAFRLFDDA
jgi:hypothetical protein